MPIFADLMAADGVDVVSGDIALERVQNGDWNIRNVYVIQELNAKHGLALTGLGAIPFLLTGCESPLFSYFFYDNLWRIAPKFRYRMLFSGAFQAFKAADGTNIPIRFPSFLEDGRNATGSISDKKFMVMVAANKSGFPPFPDKISELKSWIIHRLYKLFSPSFKVAQEHELHSKRLEIVEYFGKKGLLDLYGSGWSDRRRFPKKIRESVASVVEKLNPRFCEDKVETVSKYKFVVCLENIAYPGYVTEKIMDCFVAGAIPVYFGAPDIDKFIPANSYIDFRNFGNLEELEKYLLSLTDFEILKIIETGSEFIASDIGRLHSYGGFAENIKKIFTDA